MSSLGTYIMHLFYPCMSWIYQNKSSDTYLPTPLHWHPLSSLRPWLGCRYLGRGWVPTLIVSFKNKRVCALRFWPLHFTYCSFTENSRYLPIGTKYRPSSDLATPNIRKSPGTTSMRSFSITQLLQPELLEDPSGLIIPDPRRSPARRKSHLPASLFRERTLQQRHSRCGGGVKFRHWCKCEKGDYIAARVRDEGTVTGYAGWMGRYAGMAV